MTKEEFIADKKRAIAEISLQQVELLTASADDMVNDLAKYKKRVFGKRNRYPKPKKSYRMLVKTLTIALHLRQLEFQKRIIASQPYPKFPLGSSAVVGNNSQPEIIVKKIYDSKITTN